jgi:hypothetical protein
MHAICYSSMWCTYKYIMSGCHAHTVSIAQLVTGFETRLTCSSSLHDSAVASHCCACNASAWMLLLLLSGTAPGGGARPRAACCRFDSSSSQPRDSKRVQGGAQPLLRVARCFAKRTLLLLLLLLLLVTCAAGAGAGSGV